MHTSWQRVDEAYEAALLAFAGAILDPARSSRFLTDLDAWSSAWPPRRGHSLAELVLSWPARVPDFYQGTDCGRYHGRSGQPRPGRLADRAQLLPSSTSARRATGPGCARSVPQLADRAIRCS